MLFSGRFVALIAASVTLFGVGCAHESESVASIGTSTAITDVVAGPISEDELLSVAALMSSLPEDQRPAFQPAIEPIDDAGLTASQLLATLRRSYAAALEVGPQADQWRRNSQITAACDTYGLSPDTLAVLLTRIGCAHHASESGSQLDVASARSAGETKIADLLPQIDAARDELSRQKLVDSLGSLVAFDAYLTLLDRVPASNRTLVAAHRDRLTAILPPTPEMEINPAASQTASEPIERH